MIARNRIPAGTYAVQLGQRACAILCSLIQLTIHLLAAVTPLVPAAARAQGAMEAWVQRYDGPGNGNDYTNAMVLDGSDNV